MTSAVVLGAGGQAGIAWEIGVLVGLAQEGIDARDADVFVGTSAGAVVAAKLASRTGMARLFEEQVNPALQVSEPKPPVDFDQLRRDIANAKSGGGDTSEVLRRVGALAVATATISEAQRRRVIMARLPLHDWPEGKLRVVAVDTQSGQRVVFDAASGVDLVDAVAASCAVPGVWPPVTIAGRRYMDGGAYSTDNADFAVGCGRVLVLALRPGNPPLAVVPLEPAVHMLRKGGAEVSIVHPDDASGAAFSSVGGHLLDPSVREAAAVAGRAQGSRIASSNTFGQWH